MNAKTIADHLCGLDSVALTSHIRPDADSIGSGLALMRMLQQIGKRVAFINTDIAPHPINLLPGYELIVYGQIFPLDFSAVVLVEGDTGDRTGQKNLQNYFTICIDHHLAGSSPADLNWVVPQAGAVGELIYQLGVELGVDFDREICFNLYAAIASDTGSFKYSNTTDRSLLIAADLIKRGGIIPVEVNDLLFNSNPADKIRIMARVLSTLRLELEGRVAFCELRRSFLGRIDLKQIETEDIVAVARSIVGVEVTVFLKEISRKYYRVSVRSRSGEMARDTALFFGGGGHPNAAGFFFTGSREDAIQEITRVISDLQQ